VRRRGLLDASEVASVREEFLAGRADWTRAWLLMMLELWSREVLDRAPNSLARADGRAFEATPDACETAA